MDVCGVCTDPTTEVPLDAADEQSQPDHRKLNSDLPTMQHLMPRALWVPDILHILHNAIADIVRKMPHYAKWRESSSTVNQTLRSRGDVDLFVSTCLVGEFAMWANTFRRLQVSFLTHRWGTLIGFMVEVLPYQVPLHQGFDRNRFLGKVDARSSADLANEEIDEDDTAKTRLKKIAKFDLAVKSPLWWVYGHMILYVGGVLAELGSWAEGCPCHPKDVNRSDGLSYYKRRRQLRRDQGLKDPCCMNGRRAPDLAANKLEEVLQSACDLYLGFLMALTGRLERGDRDTVLRDWRFAVEALVTILRIKLGMWTSLPYLICGMAHWVTSIARECARQVRTRFAALHISEHHKLSILVCVTLSDELDKFIDGLDLGDPIIAQLSAVVFGLRFIVVVSRSVEARHAVAKRDLDHCPSASAAFISFRSRLPEIKKKLDSGLALLIFPDGTVAVGFELGFMFESFEFESRVWFAVRGRCFDCVIRSRGSW